MTGFYAQSFATRPTYERMIRDCIDTMKAMNVKVAFLSLGVQGDLVKNPEHGKSITVLWDKTGNHYGKGKGMRVFADGKEVFRAKNLSVVKVKL